jgi:thioredoxin 1
MNLRNLFTAVIATALAFSVAAPAQTSEQTAALKAAHTPAIAYTPNKTIYPAIEAAPADLQAALVKARAEHKRILIDFGGNWCGDCQVLEIYFHDPANWNLLQQNYVLVPVNIGRYDQNLDIAARYGVPVDKGVPALAVLDANGQLVYSQRNREFEAMRKVDPAAVTQFLLQWKG